MLSAYLKPASIWASICLLKGAESHFEAIFGSSHSIFGWNNVCCKMLFVAYLHIVNHIWANMALGICLVG